MHRGIYSISEAGKPLRKLVRLLVRTQLQNPKKNISRNHIFPCKRPGPRASGHSERRPGGRCPGAPHPPPGVRRAAWPGASDPASSAACASCRRTPAARQPRFTAAQGGGFRGRPAPRLRLQVHTGGLARGRPAPPARPHAAPLPLLPILLHSCGRPAPPPPPPPPARPPSPPSVARIGWRPRRRHFPTARGACGSPAALQARPWREARPIGARGAGRGRGRRRAGVPARPPPPARRRPCAARAASFLPSGGPVEPLRSRHTAARQGRAGRAGLGLALGLSLAPAPLLRGCQSEELETGLAEGRLLPGSHRPAPPPPRPPPPLPRPPQGPGKGRSVGKGWLSFNRRQSVSRTSVCGTRAVERGEAPLQLTPPCPPCRPSPRFPAQPA